MTIAFYAADAQELAALIAQDVSKDEEEMFFARLESYPQADFSLHLLLPDDLDRLCQSLRNYQPTLPSTFRSLLVEQLFWSEDGTESLTLLSDQLAQALTALSEEEAEQLAEAWAAPFPFSKSGEQMPAYQAVLQLWKVAQEATRTHQALLLHLIGTIGFSRLSLQEASELQKRKERDS